MYKNLVKRLIDFLVALVAIMILLPFFLVIMVWLHFANKKGSLTPCPSHVGEGNNNLQRWLEPVIFTQERTGKDEKSFKIIKFKSMTDEKDANGELLPDAQRLTKAGKFVRSTSIDELPQLINILKGDMAFVGPRPLPPVYLPYYNDHEAHRHDVRPGISGWAQVNGRKNITWDYKLECDTYYVEHLTLWLDIRIFFLTIYKVLKRESVGVETSGNVSLYDVRGVQRPEYLKND